MASPLGLSRILNEQLSNVTSATRLAYQESPVVPYDLTHSLKYPLPIIIAFCVAYSFIFVSGLIGNALVIAVVIANPKMRNPTNIFIANLAFSDILVVVVCIPSTLLVNIYHGWILGPNFCKIIPWLQGVSVTGSVINLVAIAFDRYLAICQNLNLRNTSQRFIGLGIALMWLFSLVVTSPWLFVFKYFSYSTLPPDNWQANNDLAGIPTSTTSVFVGTTGSALNLSATNLTTDFDNQKLFYDSLRLHSNNSQLLLDTALPNVSLNVKNISSTQTLLYMIRNISKAVHEKKSSNNTTTPQTHAFISSLLQPIIILATKLNDSSWLNSLFYPTNSTYYNDYNNYNLTLRAAQDYSWGDSKQMNFPFTMMENSGAGSGSPVPLPRPPQPYVINVCAEVWESETLKKIYFAVILFGLLYFVPMVIISTCYMLIWHKVCRRSIRPFNYNEQSRDIVNKSKIKVAQLLLFVMILFIISWLPLYIYGFSINFGYKTHHHTYENQQNTLSAADSFEKSPMVNDVKDDDHQSFYDFYYVTAVKNLLTDVMNQTTTATTRASVFNDNNLTTRNDSITGGGGEKEQRATFELINIIRPLTQWLGLANSCINPILYTFFHKKYRESFKALLTNLSYRVWLCLCCWSDTWSEQIQENMIRRKSRSMAKSMSIYQLRRESRSGGGGGGISRNGSSVYIRRYSSYKGDRLRLNENKDLNAEKPFIKVKPRRMSVDPKILFYKPGKQNRKNDYYVNSSYSSSSPRNSKSVLNNFVNPSSSGAVKAETVEFLKLPTTRHRLMISSNVEHHKQNRKFKQRNFKKIFKVKTKNKNPIKSSVKTKVTKCRRQTGNDQSANYLKPENCLAQINRYQLR